MIDDIPSLSNPGVEPSSGSPSTVFSFRVNYYDANRNIPSKAIVVIDGISYSMRLFSGSLDNGIYVYDTQLSSGNHAFYFEFLDKYAGIYKTKLITGPYVNYLQDGVTELLKDLWITNIGGQKGSKVYYSISIPDDGFLYDFNLWFTDCNSHKAENVRVYIKNNALPTLDDYDNYSANGLITNIASLGNWFVMLYGLENYGKICILFTLKKTMPSTINITSINTYEVEEVIPKTDLIWPAWGLTFDVMQNSYYTFCSESDRPTEVSIKIGKVVGQPTDNEFEWGFHISDMETSYNAISSNINPGQYFLRLWPLWFDSWGDIMYKLKIIKNDHHIISPGFFLNLYRSEVSNNYECYAGRNCGNLMRLMSAIGGRCSKGHDTEFRFDWGDGTLYDWIFLDNNEESLNFINRYYNNEAIGFQKTYDLMGNYPVTIRTRCYENTNIGNVSPSEFISVESYFLRADANGDGLIDISDAVYTLIYLFLGGKCNCQDATDTDDSGIIDISDVIFTLNFIFLAGETPKAPYPECGTDPQEDNLGCEASSEYCK